MEGPVSAAAGGGHALFLNRGSREKRGESDQPTNENESDGESRGIVTKRKARGVTRLYLGSRNAGISIRVDPRLAHDDENRYTLRDGLPVFSRRKFEGK